LRALRAAAGFALVSLLWLVALASPAAAHSVSGVGATNWKTTLRSVAPPRPGLVVKVVENGSRIEVTNRGPEILVLGYQGEPYLRVGPTGVWGNVVSPSTYLNCSRAGCPAPPEADAGAAPQWQQLSTGQTVRWHDHRIHWMGTQLPPEVARAPGTAHLQARWTITMRQDTTPIEATGDYRWIPGHSPLPWLALAMALAAAAIVLGRRGAWRALAVVAGLVTVNDLGHAGAIAWFWSGDTGYRLSQLIDGNSYSIAGWVLGLAAVRLLWRQRFDGLYAAVVAGASAALFTGWLDFKVLSASQAPFNGALIVDRISVAVSLGGGLGLTVAAVIGIRACRASRDHADEADQSAPDDDLVAATAPGSPPHPALSAASS
jgi:hypothetical protein